MQFTVQLFTRAHENGFFTVEVVGEPELCVYGPSLEAAREELALMLTDRLERTHPGALWRYVSPGDLRQLVLELPEAVPVHGAEGVEPSSTKATVLISRERKWLRLWVMRWGARLWVSRGEIQDEGADLQIAVERLMKGHMATLRGEARLDLRWQGEEALESLNLDVDIATPMAFTGKHRGASMLPVPAPPPEEDEDEDEGEEGKAREEGGKKPKKKKRPPTPTFKRIGVHLSKQAKDEVLERAHGRDEEVEDLYRRLTAAGGTSVVVVGPSGAGKTSVLNTLVYRLRDQKAPEKVRTRPVWFVDASRLIAGNGFFGDWQRQCLDILQECADAEVIWYVGDPLALLDAGRSAHSDQNVALMMKPHLAGGRVSLVGECTPESWAKLELRDAGFARLFSPWHLEEPEPARGRAIMEAVARELSEAVEVEVTPAGLSAIEGLCARFRGDASALGTALHFLRRLVDDADAHRAAQLTGDEEPAPVKLGRPEVVARFCTETGMPPFLIRDDLPLDTEDIYRQFATRIIGQEAAIRRMADLVAVMKAGLSDLTKPLGSFLFVGPTGVGKTETAKALAEYLFGSADRLIRFDMSEFASPSSVHRLIGAGDEEGRLISEIRQQPFCVMLLDEIEKAHPAVFDVMLQVLGEARLTDAAGRTASFCNAVVLMTSNLGVDTFKAGVGFGAGQARDGSFESHFRAEAERFFRPEFFNRIDHVVPFRPLEAPAIDRITTRELDKVSLREGLRQRGVSVALEPEVHPWIAERGVEPRYGARPLKRLIEQQLTGPLSRVLSEQGAVEHQQISVGVEGEALTFSRRDARKSTSEAGARKTLIGLVSEVARLRDQIWRWRKSHLAMQRERHLRLMDRLSQERHFWADAERAEALMRSLDPDRHILDEFAALIGQVEALEELAYEQLYDRRLEGATLLEPELEGSIHRLERLELALFDRLFESPEAGVLYINHRHRAEEQATIERLLTVYARLATIFHWSLTLYVVDEDRTFDMEAALRAAREAQKRRRAARKKGAEPRPKRYRGKDQDEEEEAEEEITPDTIKIPLVWTRAATLKGCDLPLSDAEMTRQDHGAVEELLAGSRTGQVRGWLALKVTGPHACLLDAETGLFDEISRGGNTTRARIAYTDRERLIEPAKLGPIWVDVRRKVLNEPRSRLEDVRRDIQVQLEPRAHRCWRRILMAEVYERVFGAGAHRRFRRRQVSRPPAERARKGGAA